ncbi:ATP-binding protein [Flavobacterium sp. ZB4R12]|uniref:tetratricopeptide repeat-containing sensor histidine kinase n=1 Tax=Flavobacterium sp. ZB4R12 TaxID=3398732 RepID=UPI003AAB6C3A
MILKKRYFPIYILALILFLVLQSCEKKAQKNYLKQHNTAEIERLLKQAHKHYENGKFDSSYYFYNKAKSTAELKKDTSRIIHSLAWMAQIQCNQGDHSGSETTSIEAFPFIENSNKYLYGETNIYIGLGNNYLITFDNDNAIYYFKKAINSKTDEEIKSGIINNISMAYTEKGDYQKAIQILLPLILKKELLNNPETFARINDNLGHTYDKSGSSKAFYYLNQGLKIREQIKDNWGMISSYYNLSEYYKTRNPNLSNKYALIAYKKATKVKSVDTRLESLKLLIQNSPEKKSKEFSLLYLQINDSIIKIRQKAKNQFAKIKYDSKKEKEENIKLKAQKALQLEQQQNRNHLLYFIFGIIILISILISNFLVAKNKREKIKASYTTEIRIAKKLHDELANDVYHTMAFAETQDLSTSQNKEILLNNLDTIYSRTRNISKENSTIETGPFFVFTLKEMMSGFNTSTVNILTNGIDTINWTTLEDNKKITVYRVLQELLVNMKKHSQCSLVVITFKKNENKLQIDYTDNGVGATHDKLNSKNGLQNVENRIHAIKGTVTFDGKSSKGFKVSFIFSI